jgi:hypothetical protein
MNKLQHCRVGGCLIAMLTVPFVLGQATPGAKSSSTVAVRGISGIKGAKLTNLERALQLQHKPPPPPSSANVAPLLKGPPGPPTEDPPEPTDERQLLEEVPPDQLGGS